MRTKFLLYCFCFVAMPAWASAGLTSAGVVPTTNTNTDEPTLSQVAPVQNGTSGTTASAIPGTIAGGAPVVVPGAANGAAGTANAAGGNAANGGAATTATTAVVAPPPPPDPATLPVSVIRPLNHAAGDQAPGPNASSAANGDEPPAPRERRPPASPTPAPASRSPVNAAPMTAASRISPPPGRSDSALRTAAEPATEDAVDTGSGNYIFYSGVGLAGVILLLSIGSFLRSRSEESGVPPRV